MNAISNLFINHAFNNIISQFWIILFKRLTTYIDKRS
uniref:Uncharacterized protein n=1 Tax=Siphoviridae sp. ctxMM9 TaxID=2827973 RepID=A0A8S5T7B0_9CAUD|nr:MAG TPA: hypothetical protein [Siphoviridae sp. ctxMM9]